MWQPIVEVEPTNADDMASPPGRSNLTTTSNIII